MFERVFSAPAFWSATIGSAAAYFLGGPRVGVIDAVLRGGLLGLSDVVGNMIVGPMIQSIFPTLNEYAQIGNVNLIGTFGTTLVFSALGVIVAGAGIPSIGQFVIQMLVNLIVQVGSSALAVGMSGGSDTTATV